MNSVTKSTVRSETHDTVKYYYIFAQSNAVTCVAELFKFLL